MAASKRQPAALVHVYIDARYWPGETRISSDIERRTVTMPRPTASRKADALRKWSGTAHIGGMGLSTTRPSFPSV